MNSKALKTNFFIAISLLAVSVCLLFAAGNSPSFADFYAHNIYPCIVRTIGGFSSLFPFSLSELILIILVILLLPFLIRFPKHPLRSLSEMVLLASVLFFLFAANCGINYKAPAFSEYVGLKTEGSTTEELYELCSLLTDMVNESEKKADASGLADRKLLNRNSVDAMSGLGAQYEIMSGYYPVPKGLIFSYFMSVQQLCGIYSPFTVEANYNRDMPDYNIPHSVCHELSHLKGFMREDEANFIGFLACIGSDDDYFRYSGYLTAWVYAGNRLSSADPARYRELYGRLSERVKSDLLANNEFWDRYDGKAAELQEKTNNAYLKANGQSDGVKSYGRFVDLMLAYYDL